MWKHLAIALLTAAFVPGCASGDVDAPDELETTQLTLAGTGAVVTTNPAARPMAGITFTNPRDCVLTATYVWDATPDAVAAGVAIFKPGGPTILKTKDIHGPGSGKLSLSYRATASETPTTWYANASLYGSSGGSIVFAPTLELTVNCM